MLKLHGFQNLRLFLTAQRHRTFLLEAAEPTLVVDLGFWQALSKKFFNTEDHRIIRGCPHHPSCSRGSVPPVVFASLACP